MFGRFLRMFMNRLNILGGRFIYVRRIRRLRRRSLLLIKNWKIQRPKDEVFYSQSLISLVTLTLMHLRSKLCPVLSLCFKKTTKYLFNIEKNLRVFGDFAKMTNSELISYRKDSPE